MNKVFNFLAKAFHLARGSSLAASFVLVSPMLLSKIGRFLLFLVGAGFLSVVLTACAGGGGGSGGSSGGSPPNAVDFEVKLTFAPIEGGFRIGNLSDFGNFVSLKITATSGGNDVERDININKFSSDSSYDFTGLADLDWKFQIIGILSDGGERGVDIDFVWPENKDDHGNDGIRSGLDTDGDRRADSVDEDDDGDGRDDVNDNCPLIANQQQTNTDGDGKGDACDGDDDNDGLDDTDAREQQVGLGEVSCSLLVDCDGDNVTDMDEVAAACVIKADCDDDNVRDGDEAAAECVEDTDCDDDNSLDGTDIDDDGDGLIEVASAAQLDEVRHALDGSGRRSTDGGALDSTGCGDGAAITSCSGYELVADISLAAYANWQPLGRDNDTSTDGCQGEAFDGTFEGNGWMISDLSISRSGEDCVGLFGHVAADSEIRNLRLSAERVRGRRHTGGLVGRSQNATIISSSVVATEVRGKRDNIGGLVGSAAHSQIFSSSVVVDRVGESGVHQSTGGLVGGGSSVRIHSSSVVAGEVSGSSFVGGLVGGGSLVRIHSSSVVVGRVSGGGFKGGLVAVDESTQAQIHSSSVVAGEVSGGSFTGGLVGVFGSDRVAYSYVVSGSDIAMLAASGTGTGAASYWDRNTSGRDSGNFGEAKTSNQLREPTGYTGIYEDWDDDTDIFGDGMSDDPFAVWCDEDNSGSIEMDERVDENRIWDFGTSSQYPAIRCTPLAPAEWRSWWSLDENGNPALNQTRLDALSN